MSIAFTPEVRDSTPNDEPDLGPAAGDACKFPGCLNPVAPRTTAAGAAPKYCVVHKDPAQRRKGSTVRTGAPRVRSGSASEGKARDAARALVAINSLVGTGLFMFGYEDTSREIADRQEMFEQQAFEALLTDPALCEMILRAGVASGRASLIVAYGMLAAGVIPAAMVEAREKRSARLET